MPQDLTVKNASGTTVTIQAPSSGDPTISNVNTNLGALTETAPANDTASSGLNGRLQRIAQRLTSLIALLPASLGAKAGTGSISVVAATDGTWAASQSGTWDIGSISTLPAIPAGSNTIGTVNLGTIAGVATQTTLASVLTAVDPLTFNPIATTHAIVTATSTSQTLTPASGATKIQIQVETGAIRYTLDGTTPTTTLGFLLDSTYGIVTLPIRANTSIKIIRSGSVDATVQVEYAT